MTREITFAREAGDRVYYTDAGTLVEAEPSDHVVGEPRWSRGHHLANSIKLGREKA